MEKTLKYYMNLPYTITVVPGEDNDGSPIFISRVMEIPYVIGDGKTRNEALDTLNIHMRMVIKSYLKDGIPIPEPQTKYSGNLNIRVDPELHSRLAKEAAAYNMSLNKYASLILERRQISLPVKKAALVRERNPRYTAKAKKSK
jgi:predicted HicB family RNase H-like nuclease